MTKTNLDIIRDACIKANPEIKKRPSVLSFNGREPIGVPDNNGPHIGLADVLLALGEKEHFFDLDMGGGFHYGFENKAQWDLKNDDLTKQSPQTIEFLAELLRE